MKALRAINFCDIWTLFQIKVAHIKVGIMQFGKNFQINNP